MTDISLSDAYYSPNLPVTGYQSIRFMSKKFLGTFILSLIAVVIIAGTFFYSGYLSTRIAEKESRQMQQWVTAQQLIAKAGDDVDISLPAVIIAEQKDIPVIETNEQDSIMSFLNLDSQSVATNPQYLQKQLQAFKKEGHVVTTFIDPDGRHFNRYYYGESQLLMLVRYFPVFQLIIVIIFIAMLLSALRFRHKTEQDGIWTGLAKETAHQLGTPISALSGWTAMLKESDDKEWVLIEMEKDISRLNRITERFSMIGSTPRKTSTDLRALILRTMDYVRKRAASSIGLQTGEFPDDPVMVEVAAPLIEWVIENLLKNALDAMEEGRGLIRVDLHQVNNQPVIDVTDNGKGIALADQEQVFRPGFSTKKRGWGLGLTLSKRIVEEYHGGQLIIRNSEQGKGTTFRIILKK